MNLFQSTNIYSSSQSCLQSPKCSKLTQWIPTTPASLLTVVGGRYWRLLFYPEHMQLAEEDALLSRKAWNLVSDLDTAHPPDMHTWNGWFCDLYLSTTSSQYSNSGQITCFPHPHVFFQFWRAYGFYCIIHSVNLFVRRQLKFTGRNKVLICLECTF